MNISKEIRSRTADTIDRLITADLPDKRRVLPLYEAARSVYGCSPTLLAAERLVSVLDEPKRVVFVCSGWPNRPMVNPDIAETDGPPGAAVIARALREGFDAVPILLFEEHLLSTMGRVVEAAGLRVLDSASAVRGAQSLGAAQVAGILGFPSDPGKAKVRADELLAEFAPAAVLVTEKGGMNSKGVIHSLRGEDITGPMAKVDFLLEAANASGILTVAIGDAGNEAGLGAFADLIREEFPFGKKCRCPCGAGSVPRSAADVALIAAVSNWGASALVACLALLKGDPGLLHTARREKRILDAAAAAGLTDGLKGWVAPSVDGLPLETSLAIVDLLGTAVHQGLQAAQAPSAAPHHGFADNR